MFSHDAKSGHVVCLEDYGRLKKGAIVPVTNELYADVEAWIAEGNTLAPFDGYPEIPMTEEQLQDWREAAEVSAYQAFAELDAQGLLDQVETKMADPATPNTHRIAFQKAQTFRRMSPTVLYWLEQLSITPEQADAMFQSAAQRQA